MEGQIEKKEVKRMKITGKKEGNGNTKRPEKRKTSVRERRGRK